MLKWKVKIVDQINVLYEFEKGVQNSPKALRIFLECSRIEGKSFL